MQAISLKHFPVKPCSTPAMSCALSALMWSLSSAMRALLFLALIVFISLRSRTLPQTFSAALPKFASYGGESPSPHPLPVKNGERECAGVPAKMQKRALSFTPSPRLWGEGGARGSLPADLRWFDRFD